MYSITNPHLLKALAVIRAPLPCLFPKSICQLTCFPIRLHLMYLTTYYEINMQKSLRDWIISTMSSISLLDIISVAALDPKSILWIPALAPDAAVNLNTTSTLLASVINILFINGPSCFISSARIQPRNPTNCIILDSWTFHNFTSFDELFANALWRLVTCLSSHNKLCGKLFSLVAIMSDDNHFTVDFKSSRWKPYKLRFSLWNSVIFYLCQMEHVYNTFTICFW